MKFPFKDHQKKIRVSSIFWVQLQDGTLQVLALGEVEKRRGEHWAMVKVGELQEGEMLALPWLERLGRSDRHVKRTDWLEVPTKKKSPIHGG